MSALDLLRSLRGAQSVLLAVAYALPVLLGVWAVALRRAQPGRVFGHAASTTIAVGLLSIVVEGVLLTYLRGKGVDLFEDVSLAVMAAPIWLGLGSIWAASQAMPFAELRRYPLLRRVWSMLLAAALILAAWLVLKHTYWLVFSGIVGFLIVAIIAWTLFQKLVGRVTGKTPDQGDPDLWDEVASDSRRRVGRLAGELARPYEKKPPS